MILRKQKKKKVFCFFQKNVIIPCKIKIVCCFSNVSGVNNKTLVQPQCSTVTWTLNIRLLIYCEWNFWQEEHMSVVFFIYLFTLAVFFLYVHQNIFIIFIWVSHKVPTCKTTLSICSTWWPSRRHYHQHCPLFDLNTFCCRQPAAGHSFSLQAHPHKKNPCNSSMCLCKGWFLQDCKISSDCHQMSKTCCVEF